MTDILKTNISFTYINWDVFQQRHQKREFLKSYIVDLTIDIDVGIDVKQAKLAYLIFDDARHESALVPITDNDMKSMKEFEEKHKIKFETVSSDLVTFVNKVEASSLGKLLKGKYEYLTVDDHSNYKLFV